MGLSLVNMLGPLSGVRIAHIACYWKIFLLHNTQDLCQYRLFKDHVWLTYLTLQRQLSHLKGRKLDHSQFNSLIFSMPWFTMSYVANMLIHMILYDFCLLSAQFCYIIVYIRKVASKSKSKSKLLYDWRCTANQLAPSRLRLMTRDFFNWTLAVMTNSSLICPAYNISVWTA
jgi:hypothetical protein